MRNSWPSDERKALITLPLLKQHNLEAKLGKTLGLLFGAGVPVILWSRKALLSLENSGERELDPIWDECHQKNYKRLWNIVHDLRKSDEALTNPAHTGNYLTMVWDTPDRMLPDKKEFGE